MIPQTVELSECSTPTGRYVNKSSATVVVNGSYAAARGVGRFVDSLIEPSRASVSGNSVRFMEAYIVPEPLPPNTRSVESLVDRWVTEGFGDELTAARKRLAGRVRGHGRSLRGLRLTAGLSQADLARAIGSSQPHVARLEAGSADPGRETMRKLARVFDVDMNRIDEAFGVGDPR
ncbi:helix-turn-helix domain-containing protein [Xanthomonas campestris]|uniref:helix-turn-helix transcriptional regulator n=1 Tax=Xanthomonas campestris TaxID=339 RepID=UPI000E1E5E5E